MPQTKTKKRASSSRSNGGATKSRAKTSASRSQIGEPVAREDRREPLAHIVPFRDEEEPHAIEPRRGKWLAGPEGKGTCHGGRRDAARARRRRGRGAQRESGAARGSRGPRSLLPI